MLMFIKVSNTSHFWHWNNKVIHRQNEIQQTQSRLHCLEVGSVLECSSQHKMAEQLLFLSQLLPNTIAQAGGRQYGDEFCALDLRVLGFHIVVYNKAKQIANPIYLSTPYEHEI